MWTLAPAVRPVATDDGSVTLKRVDTGWTYRSARGALSEANHVFVQGSGVLGRREFAIAEFGFGAGTNFAAVVRAARAAGSQKVRYHAVENAPVDADTLPAFDPLAHALARAAAGSGQARDQGVSLCLDAVDFVEAALPADFDAVFFDPFGPGDQPQSWSVAALQAAAAAMRPHARLVTYSAAGWVRRNMATAGLYVATVPGPPGGKREFTLAARHPEALGGAKVRNAPR